MKFAIEKLEIWERLRSSYWFIPAVMVIASAVLSFFTLHIDEIYGVDAAEEVRWIYSGDIDATQNILLMLAGAMITVTGVVFSVTLVALSLASSQFGSRVIRSFMRDVGTQVVLGTFTGTFIFCLLIVRKVNNEQLDEEMTLNVSVSVAMLLAIFSIGVLIYFIHHLAASIQINHVVKVITTEIEEDLERLIPTKKEKREKADDSEERHEAIPEEGETQIIEAREDGYIEAIDYDTLMEIGKEKDLHFSLEGRVGSFMVSGFPLVRAWPKEHMDENVSKRISKTISIENTRTPTQDIEFGINQLVEIALHALSTGINDPFVAMMCLDRIGQVLCRLFERKFPPAHRRDDEGVVRVITPIETLEGVADAAFHQIRQASRTNVAVSIRMLEVMALVAECTSDEEGLGILWRHGTMVRKGSLSKTEEESDRADIEERYRTLLSIIEKRREKK